jgi:hypothetical protein
LPLGREPPWLRHMSQSSQQVAEELMLGRTTVLKILKAARVIVRPHERR